MNKPWYKKIPKSKGRNFCDELWAELVKIRDNHKCIMCDSTEMLNAHHLISRRVFRYRWNIDNGVTICPGHHEFSLIMSFHTSPWATEDWMKINRPEQYETWCKNRISISEEFETDYDPIYLDLEEKYKIATGNYKRIERIASYILFTKIDTIVNLHLQDSSVTDISKQMNVGEKVLKEFMKKNKII